MLQRCYELRVQRVAAMHVIGADKDKFMKVAAAADVSELVLSTLRRKLSLAAGLEIRLKKEEKESSLLSLSHD